MIQKQTKLLLCAVSGILMSRMLQDVQDLAPRALLNLSEFLGFHIRLLLLSCGSRTTLEQKSRLGSSFMAWGAY